MAESDLIGGFLAWFLGLEATRRLFGGALLLGLIWPALLWAWNWRRY